MKDDAKFKSELIGGYDWELFVAWQMLLEGFSVQVSKLKIRARVEDRHKFAQQKDLKVNGWIYEIKSRNEKFTCPIDYPYGTAFVETVKSWDAKIMKPVATLLVSRETKVILAVPLSSRFAWKVEEKYDRTREINETFYASPKRFLWDFNYLVQHIREQKW